MLIPRYTFILNDTICNTIYIYIFIYIHIYKVFIMLYHYMHINLNKKVQGFLFTQALYTIIKIYIRLDFDSLCIDHFKYINMKA
jgi:heme/copper-type cytochrome/quinol oxidase subunit 4